MQCFFIDEVVLQTFDLELHDLDSFSSFEPLFLEYVFVAQDLFQLSSHDLFFLLLLPFLGLHQLYNLVLKVIDLLVDG